MSWATLSAATNRVAFNRLGSVNVIFGNISGQGFLSMPSQYVTNGRSISDEYGLQVETSKFGNLSYSSTINVAGQPYEVREKPLLLDDGTFCLVLLTKLETNLIVTLSGLTITTLAGEPLATLL